MSACVTRIFLVEKVTFYIRTCLHDLIDSIVFFWNSFQLTISAGPKYVCYIKQNCNMIDGISHQS